MFCENCGAEAPGGNAELYCDLCGADLADDDGARKGAGSRPLPRRKTFLTASATLGASGLALLIVAAAMARGGCGGSSIDASAGGVHEDADGFRVVVPPGTLPAGAAIEVRRGVSNPTSKQLPGEIIDVGSSTTVLAKQVRIEIPIDETQLPDGLSLENVFPLTFRGDRWIELPGSVDTQAGTVAVETRHLSLFSWFVNALRRQRHSPFRDAYLRFAPLLFGPQVDPYQALQAERSEHDALARTILAQASSEPARVEGDARVLARMSIDGRALEVVATDRTALDGSQRPLAALRDAGSGEIVRNRELVYRGLFSWQARDRLRRMNRSKLAASLRRNAVLLREMRDYHQIARAMDVSQQVLSDVLATGTVGTGIVDLSSYVGPALGQIVATIADLEMFRAARTFEEVAAELERFSADDASHDELMYLYSLVADAADRTDSVRSFAEDTFPGYRQSWATYTSKRVLLSFLGAGARGHRARAQDQIEDVSRAGATGRLNPDVAAHILEELQGQLFDAQVAERTLAVLSIVSSSLENGGALSRYFGATRARGELLGTYHLWAEAALAARAVSREDEQQEREDAGPEASENEGAFSYLTTSGNQWTYGVVAEGAVFRRTEKIVRSERRRGYTAIEVRTSYSGGAGMEGGGRTDCFAVYTDHVKALLSSGGSGCFHGRPGERDVYRASAARLQKVEVQAGVFQARCQKSGPRNDGEKCLVDGIGLVRESSLDSDGMYSFSELVEYVIGGEASVNPRAIRKYSSQGLLAEDRRKGRPIGCDLPSRLESPSYADVDGDGLEEACIYFSSLPCEGFVASDMIQGNCNVYSLVGGRLERLAGLRESWCRCEPGRVAAKSPHYAPDDPMCCPSLEKRSVYTWDGGSLRKGGE